MEAIRQAGGSGKAKLRSAKDIKIEAKKKKQASFEKGVPVNNFLRPSMAQAVGYQPLTQRSG
jgi:hypothetical protein